MNPENNEKISEHFTKAIKNAKEDLDGFLFRGHTQKQRSAFGRLMRRKLTKKQKKEILDYTKRKLKKNKAYIGFTPEAILFMLKRVLDKKMRGNEWECVAIYALGRPRGKTEKKPRKEEDIYFWSKFYRVMCETEES